MNAANIPITIPFNPTAEPDRAKLTSIVELVRMAQAGDGGAFESLVEHYRKSVITVAWRRLGDMDEAEEISQEAFFQAWCKLDQLRDPHCFGAWLRRMADRMAINVATRRKIGAPTDSAALEAASIDEQTPVTRAVDREESIQVREGIARLGQTDRETLRAFYFANQSVLEMSETFGSPVGTIKRRLHVARKRLAKEIESLARA